MHGIYLQEGIYHYMDPRCLGQFHSECHETCIDEEQLQDSQKLPGNKLVIPAGKYKRQRQD